MRFFDVGAEATGVIAFGQIASGVIAVGQVATGVIAIGQLARGVVAIGQLSAGVAAIGQVGVGAAYGAGMVGVGALGGGLLPVGIFGRWSLGALLRFDAGEIVLAAPRRISLRVLWTGVVVVGVLAIALGPLWETLFGVGGVIHRPR
jgi:hypothetical protein